MSLVRAAEGKQKLSEEWAAAVANYFIGRGAKVNIRIVARAYETEPFLIDNSTEVGQQKNRRLEINLL